MWVRGDGCSCNPIAYLSWMLHQTDLTNRPCAMEEVYAAHEADLAAQRQAAAPTQRAAAAAAREAGRAALHGDARQQVRDILTHRVRTAAASKGARIRAEQAARAEFVTHRRGAQTSW